MKNDHRWGIWQESDILDLGRLAEMIAGGAPVDRPMGIASMDMPLGVAAGHENVDACRLLLEAGADANTGKAAGRSVFCVVIEARNPRFSVTKDPVNRRVSDADMRRIFDLLVQYGATPDGQKDIGLIDETKSPVFIAASRGDSEAVRVLAQLGANLNVTCDTTSYPAYEKSFSTPLAEARKKGHGSVVLALLAHGAQEEALTDNELTPFQASVAAGLDQVVSYYVHERGEDLAQRTARGRTLAQLAKHDSTRALLKSLKTELAVANGVAGRAGTAKTIKPAKNGPTPL